MSIKDNSKLNEFLEMDIHETKSIIDGFHYQITLLRVIGGFLYITRAECSNSVSTTFVSEKDLEHKMQITEE